MTSLLSPIDSSGIIWQNKVRRRYKDLSVREMKSLEEGFVKAGLDASDQKDLPPRVYKLDHGMEVRKPVTIEEKPKRVERYRSGMLLWEMILFFESAVIITKLIWNE